MSITLQHTKENLCRAHIHALAGIAGTNIGLQSAHDYGVDGQFDPVIIRNSRRVQSGFPLQFQAKATTDWWIEDEFVVYDLESKTYNDMVTRSEDEVALLLVLLCLPKEQPTWHATTAECTTLRNCCYWDWLRGTPVPNEKSTKRIRIPQTQVLTPDTLLELLKAEKQRRLGSGS